jgi:hypothetical protein
MVSRAIDSSLVIGANLIMHLVVGAEAPMLRKIGPWLGPNTGLFKQGPGTFKNKETASFNDRIASGDVGNRNWVSN